MIKNPYKRTDRREAFDKAVELTFEYKDEMDQHILLVSKIAKELDPIIPREMRKRIAAHAIRLVKKHWFIARGKND